MRGEERRKGGRKKEREHAFSWWLAGVGRGG